MDNMNQLGYDPKIYEEILKQFEKIKLEAGIEPDDEYQKEFEDLLGIDFDDLETIKDLIENNLNANHVVEGQKGLVQFLIDTLLKDEEGNAFGVDDFGTKLRKYMKKTYQLNCSNYPVGTGKAVLVIGGKSQ